MLALDESVNANMDMVASGLAAVRSRGLAYCRALQNEMQIDKKVDSTFGKGKVHRRLLWLSVDNSTLHWCNPLKKTPKDMPVKSVKKVVLGHNPKGVEVEDMPAGDLSFMIIGKRSLKLIALTEADRATVVKAICAMNLAVADPLVKKMNRPSSRDLLRKSQVSMV